MPAFRRSQNGDYWIQRHLIRSELIQQNSKAAEKKERCPQGAFGGPSRVRTDDLRIKRHYVVGGSGGGRYLPEQSRHVARNVFGVFAYPYELG